jgi:general stress protein CsbA
VLHLFVLFVAQQKHYLQIILCVTLICSSLCNTTKTLSTNHTLCYTYLFFSLYHNKNIIYKLYSVLHLFILHFVPQQKHYLQIIVCVTLICSSLCNTTKNYLQIIFCVTLICSSLCTTTKTLSTNYSLCYTYLFFTL